jgi:hypothetical protein
MRQSVLLSPLFPRPMQKEELVADMVDDNTIRSREVPNAQLWVSHAVEVSSAFSVPASGDLARVGGEAASETEAASSCASPDGSRDASALGRC